MNQLLVVWCYTFIAVGPIILWECHPKGDVHLGMKVIMWCQDIMTAPLRRNDAPERFDVSLWTKSGGVWEIKIQDIVSRQKKNHPIVHVLTMARLIINLFCFVQGLLWVSHSRAFTSTDHWQIRHDWHPSCLWCWTKWTGQKQTHLGLNGMNFYVRVEEPHPQKQKGTSCQFLSTDLYFLTTYSTVEC